VRIYKIAEDLEWYTIENTTDPEILRNILRRENNDTVSQFAALNPNCPPEVLAEVLRRGKDDTVSREAALNPTYKKYLIKIQRSEKQLKLKEEKFNSNIRSNVNSLFYGIQVNDDR